MAALNGAFLVKSGCYVERATVANSNAFAAACCSLLFTITQWLGVLRHSWDGPRQVLPLLKN